MYQEWHFFHQFSKGILKEKKYSTSNIIQTTISAAFFLGPAQISNMDSIPTIGSICILILHNLALCQLCFPIPEIDFQFFYELWRPEN